MFECKWVTNLKRTNAQMLHKSHPFVIMNILASKNSRCKYTQLENGEEYLYIIYATRSPLLFQFKFAECRHDSTPRIGFDVVVAMFVGRVDVVIVRRKEPALKQFVFPATSWNHTLVHYTLNSFNPFLFI